MEELKRQVLSCKKCPLHMNKTNYVFGEGSGNYMLIGEAPGEMEDKLGKPFVGRAGKLLDGVLNELGMDRSMFFITNVVKCRPPNNRNPKLNEILSCKSYLDKQVELLSPKAIICLGRFAGMVVLNKFNDFKIKDFRGRILESIYGIPAIITYHPASALRSKLFYTYLKEDLKMFRDSFLRL